MTRARTAILLAAAGSLVALASTVAARSATRAPEVPAPAVEYPIRAVPLTEVRFVGGFWAPRLERNRTVSLAHILARNDATGRVANFLKAARRQQGAHEGMRYNDTDVYKAIEAAAYVLATTPDAALARQVDELVTIVAAAQEPDGYLFTARTVDPSQPAPGAGPQRWSYLHTSHELYNAGHLYEAAVAHFEATGKRTLLDVAIRNANLVCDVFGPGKRLDAPGHQEIELALVKLWRATGNRRYLDQARFFLAQRGRPHSVPPVRFEPGDRFAIYNDLAYRQDHLPVEEQTRAVGHAVRATYMFSAMADVAQLLSEAAYGRAVDALWRDITGRRLYLTGGLGAQGETEAFGDDYVLPNDTAYAETCASIGGVLWHHRMFRRTGDAAYLDVLERTLYNGVLSGVSHAGDTFFYENPLASDGTVARRPYFDVACCPANLSRLLAQLPSLVYARDETTLFVNLFAASDATTSVRGTPVRISQRTEYPWDGRVELTIEAERPVEFAVALRVPGWARGEPVPGTLYRDASSAAETPSLTLDGNDVPVSVDRGFARLLRTWEEPARVVLTLPMPVRRTLAHERVEANRGAAAIERGPLVYCVEAVDHDGRVRDLRLPLDAGLRPHVRPDLLGGIVTIESRAGREAAGRQVTAVPYFSWANRGAGEMVVWIPYQ